MPSMQATIADTAAISGVIDLGTSGFFTGLKAPAMTTVTSLSFQVCESPTGTFAALYDAAGTLVTAACSTSAAQAASINPADFAGWRYIKIVAGSGSGTAQSGTKTFYVQSRTRLD